MRFAHEQKLTTTIYYLLQLVDSVYYITEFLNPTESWSQVKTIHTYKPENFDKYCCSTAEFLK